MPDRDDWIESRLSVFLNQPKIILFRGELLFCLVRIPNYPGEITWNVGVGHVPCSVGQQYKEWLCVDYVGCRLSVILAIPLSTNSNNSMGQTKTRKLRGICSKLFSGFAIYL